MGVKDDVELIDACIRHLWSIGVDLVIAYDDGSTDGTLDILNSLKSEEHLWVVNVENLRPRRPHLTETWRLEYSRKANPDWVFFLDVDEFWVPATGSLRDCCNRDDVDVLTVDRFNVALTEKGAIAPEALTPSRYDELLLCIETIPDFRLYLEQHPEVPWVLGNPIIPKVLARPDLISTVGAGGHLVESRGGTELRHAKALDVFIAHFPFTTFDRFERKVSNITGIIQEFPEFFFGYVAWHWTRWASMFESGQLREEFERQVFSERLVKQMMDAGVISTAAQILDRLKKHGSAKTHNPDYDRLLEEWF